MAVTGALLTYQRQMTAWADMRGYYAAPGPDTKRLSPDAIVSNVRQARPDLTPTTLVMRADRSAPASLAIGQGRTLFVNPYAGTVLGEG